MKTIGTLIQALMLAGVVVYALPYLIETSKEFIAELKEDKR
jgi:hypothetical protein